MCTSLHAELYEALSWYAHSWHINIFFTHPGIYKELATKHTSPIKNHHTITKIWKQNSINQLIDYNNNQVQAIVIENKWEKCVCVCVCVCVFSSKPHFITEQTTQLVQWANLHCLCLGHCTVSVQCPQWWTGGAPYRTREGCWSCSMWSVAHTPCHSGVDLRYKICLDWCFDSQSHESNLVLVEELVLYRFCQFRYNGKSLPYIP